jgi:hypothetical protein
MSEERTIIRGPNGETWQEPPPNSPVQMKPGWLTKMQMDVANAKPIPRGCFAVERGLAHGWSAGFACNGILWSGTRPR